ncbi:MAG TPA: hypothetical protein VMX74_06905 [Pirellulales bacterium]|nr:hypothetical protein [Pirellulales bacterium]
MDTRTDQQATHLDFGPSYSAFAKMVLPCVIGGGIIVYLDGNSALPFVTIVIVAYVTLWGGLRRGQTWDAGFRPGGQAVISD